jgi:hypothetical protein
VSTSAPPDRFLDGLNEAQLEAVRAIEGPLAIIAGAGTGKTRVISRRTAFAIASGAVAICNVFLQLAHAIAWPRDSGCSTWPAVSTTMFCRTVLVMVPLKFGGV